MSRHWHWQNEQSQEHVLQQALWRCAQAQAQAWGMRVQLSAAPAPRAGVRLQTPHLILQSPKPTMRQPECRYLPASVGQRAETGFPTRIRHRGAVLMTPQTVQLLVPLWSLPLQRLRTRRRRRRPPCRTVRGIRCRQEAAPSGCRC